MRKIVTIITGCLLVGTFAFGQTDNIQIVSTDDNVDYSGQSFTIVGDFSFNHHFEMVNTGQSAKFNFARKIISQSDPSFIIQFCDKNTCHNTDGAFWIDSINVQVAQNGSTMFKPAILTPSVGGTAEVVYYVLDQNYQKLDSITIHFQSTTAVTENQKPTFKLYPNPAKGQITLHGEALKNGGILVISDALGNIVKKLTIQNEVQTIRLNDVKRGVYFVNFFNEDGVKSETKRLIVQ